MFPKVDRFKEKEFPVNEILFTDPRVFLTLNKYAKRLGHAVYPSTAKGALARMYGDPNSRHYAIGRVSTAVDFFPDAEACEAWTLALSYFKGVGVYFDTHRKDKRMLMLHGDLRNTATYWYRERGLYHKIYDYKAFYKKLSEWQNEA